MARILVVDDNGSLLSALGLTLREQGHLVTSTNNGADAICLLGAKPAPDLLILDIVMPGLDGHEVIKNLGPTAPPVIVISGEEILPEEATSSVVARVLGKPFDRTKLLEAVEWALHKSPENKLQ